MYKLGKTVQQIMSVEKTVSQKLKRANHVVKQVKSAPLVRRLWSRTQLIHRWETKNKKKRIFRLNQSGKGSGVGSDFSAEKVTQTL